MIKGRYEITIYFDADGNKAKKEMKMGNTFENSTEFIAQLMEDLRDVSPILNKFIPVGSEVKVEEDANL